jgi:hypothetical protein
MRGRRPRERGAEYAAERHRDRGDDQNLDGEPGPAGDALVPHQPVGAGLQFPRHQRRTPEHADEHGCQADRTGEVEQEIAVVTVELAHSGGAVATRVAPAAVGVVGAPDVGPQVQKIGKGDGEQRGAEERGRAELPPGEPDHRCALPR